MIFVCFKWKGGGKRVFTSHHVNTLYKMLADNYRLPFRFVCITDDTTGLLEIIETLPLPDMPDIEAPQGKLYPSCYRRLWLFSQEAAELLPGKVVCMDIDLVITGDVTEFFNRPEDCVMWADSDNHTVKYSGGLWMITTGTRTHVWDTFDPVESPKITKDAGMLGSDQAWISYCLDGEAGWDRSHGLYRTRNLVPGCEPLIVQTPNIRKPWTQSFQTAFPQYAKIWNHYAEQPTAEVAMPQPGKYRILKKCTRGDRGDVVEVAAADVKALQRNGVIGTHRIESSKPEVLK